jgi:hypothetical protein
MASLAPSRAYETKLEIFERWTKWAEAGHHDSILIETFDLIGLRRPVLLHWGPERPAIISRPAGSTAEASAPQAPPALPAQAKARRPRRARRAPAVVKVVATVANAPPPVLLSP